MALLSRSFAFCIICQLLLTDAIAATSHDSPERIAFNSTYDRYLRAEREHRWTDALPAVEQSLALGLQTFREDGINIANLRVKLATVLNRTGKTGGGARARSLLGAARPVLEAAYGTDSLEVVDLLIETAVAEHDPTRLIRTVSLLRMAVKNARQGGAEMLAEVNFTAGTALLKLRSSSAAEPFLARSQAQYHEIFGDADLRTAVASQRLGIVRLRKRNPGGALPLLSTALKAFARHPHARAQEVQTLTALVAAIERTGRHDQATPHCVRVAEMLAVDGNAAPWPIVSTPPATPRVPVTDGGAEVVVGFNLDERGMIFNPIIISSTDGRLNAAALRAVRKDRYTPKLAAGTPVKAEGLTRRLQVH